MARIKFASGVDPIRGKSNGFTFQWNTAAHNMYAKSRNSRTRYPNQSNSQQFLWRALNSWRNMPAGVKQAWNDYAAAYPEASKHNPAVMLSGYQLFLKRNSYVSLNCGLDYDFMTAPTMEVLPAPSVSFELKAGTNSIDVTEMYLKYFGVIPSPGQSVLFRCIPMSQTSGQFFDVINDVLTVEEVYVDGFFLNLIFPANPQNLLFSIFLSKPVSPGQSYAGTKIRYMGCFGSKTFVGLSDVPAVGVPDAGKVWGVKPDGTWGVIEGGGGGGLTCEDLPDCAKIIQIDTTISNIVELLIKTGNVSIPAVNYGLLYNRASAVLPNLSSSDSWVLPTRLQIISLQSYLGGESVAGSPLKVADLAYWQSITGNTNAKLFNSRGSGQRSGTPASYSQLLQRNYLWTSTPYFGAGLYYFYTAYNVNGLYLAGANLYNIGFSVRFCKIATGVSDGIIGVYFGNNGRAYRTVVINQIEYMADNLAEDFYRDGTPVTEISDPTTWQNNALPAFCAYSNDWLNV